MRDSSLFYACSLIEYIGRMQKLDRKAVVTCLGKETVERIYDYADVFHCEPIEKVANDFVELRNIPLGNFDNVSSGRYQIPDYWTIGEVYSRLIEDISKEKGTDTIQCLLDVYSAWISESISNYNSDFYYQPRDYIKECYLANEICA